VSQETGITAEKPREKHQHEPTASNPPAEYRWVKCIGCEGEIGVPATWEGDTADCPQCGTQVRVDGRLHYRPPSRPTPLPTAKPPASIALPAPKVPSVDLQREADRAMILGILCVFFGWTVLVSLFSLCYYSDVSSLAKKEGIPVPLRATIGLIFTLVFGGMQTLALIVKLNH
jgi:hypothetical protein